MVDSVEHAALLLTRLSEIASQQADANEKPNGTNRSSGDLKSLATNSDGADKAADESRLDQAPSPIPSVVTPTMGSPVQSCSSFPVLPSSLQALPPPPRLGVENPSILQPLQYKLRSKKYTPQTDEIKEVSTPFPETSKSNFVGETTPQKVRGVLKQKFSWKKFPELEEFLILQRKEYFRHASEHNYTRKQRDFNNSLTDQLLEYASKLGYVFDGFTFVMLRDRIRCYYKSYLQCLRERARRRGEDAVVVPA